MDPIIETRLKQMRKLLTNQIKDKVKQRKSLNELRKEKRYKILNYRRGIDLDWFQMDLNDDYDYGLSISDDKKSVQMVIDLMSEKTSLSEGLAKRCIEEVIKVLKDNNSYRQELVRIDFFQMLSTFVANPIIACPLKMVAIDLIEAIVSNIENVDNREISIVIESRIVLSVMTSFDTFELELLTKTVKVLHIITNLSIDILTVALKHGYLNFLMQIIKSIQVFKHRKSTQTNQMKRMFEMKLNLIREISRSLQFLVFDLTNPELIPQLFISFEKLIHLKDLSIVLNALSSLSTIVERNNDSIVLLTKQLVLSVTDLLYRNNSDIRSAVLRFWNIFIDRIDFNCHDFYGIFLIESNLIKNLYKILENVENNENVKQVANILTQLVSKFPIIVKLLFDSNMIPLIVRAIVSSDIYSRRQLLSTIMAIIATIDSKQAFNHLLESKIFQALAHMLCSEDPSFVRAPIETYHYIMSLAEQLDQKECVFHRVLESNINVIIESFNKPDNSCQPLSIGIV